jgi:drug/metabolite transporter (DMT)-like permease
MGGHTTNAALFAVLCLFLGSSYAWTKLGLEGLDPLTFVLSRLLIGVGVLGLWLRLSGEGVPRERGLYALGLLNVLGAFLLLTWGQQYVESSHAAILVASGPIFSALGATYVLPDERLDRRRAAGVALGFVGVIALFSGDLGGSSTTRTGHEIAGAVAIVVSAVVIAAIAIVVRLRFPGYSATQIALPQVTGGLVAVTLVTLLAGAGGLVTF